MKNIIELYLRRIAKDFIKSKNTDEDIARREYIFNILLLGFLLLTLSAFIVSLKRTLYNATTEQNVPTLVLLLPVILLLILYGLSRKRFDNRLVYIFIALMTALGTYSLHKYGYILPQGLLIYVLVIVISGMLVPARDSIIITVIIFCSLGALALMQITGKVEPYVTESSDPLGIGNFIIYILIFVVIFLVSWLSNREIALSLKRARQSELELLAEREMLEDKIKERTKELEYAQVEKSMELYRFAEFGRLSSSLLHDIANPLTAISLNLEQISYGKKSRAAAQVRQGVTHMEQYVQSARRQLRNQSDIVALDTKTEIEKVIKFLISKSRKDKVKLICRLSKGAIVLGDSAKFSQIMANLIANALDSYSGAEFINKRTVLISSKVNSVDNTIAITIKDNGVGIPDEEISKIFNPFFTTKSSDRGTGIGLTITKRIVEEDFKGIIKVESSKNGTIFKVDLPLYTITP